MNVAYEAGSHVDVDEHDTVNSYGVENGLLKVRMAGGRKREYNMDKVVWYGQ